MVYVIRTTKCRNGVMEKTKFPVFDIADRAGTSTRDGKRAVNRAAKNAGSARRNFARLLNNNFKAGDRFLTLDLSESGMQKVAKRAEGIRMEREKAGRPSLSEEDLMHMAMERELENLNRRVLRAIGAAQSIYLYAAAVSDMAAPEEDAASARLHIHMVVNAAAAETVEQKWKAMGSVESVKLSAWASKGVPDWTALAAYIIGQTRVVDNGKRYTVSRTVDKPVFSDRVAVRPDALLRAPTGTVLLEQGAYVPGRAQYIRYIYPAWDDRSGERGGDAV